MTVARTETLTQDMSRLPIKEGGLGPTSLVRTHYSKAVTNKGKAHSKCSVPPPFQSVNGVTASEARPMDALHIPELPLDGADVSAVASTAPGHTLHALPR
jgi:hypothetical protein